MKKVLLLLLFIVTSLATKAQSISFTTPGMEPLIFLDSLQISTEVLRSITPDSISSFRVYKNQEAIDLAGKGAKYGVIYVETTRFAKKKYWKFLSGKSSAYKQSFPNPGMDAKVTYILNGIVLGRSYPSELASLTDENFIDLNIINSEHLANTYKVKDGELGVVIKSKSKAPKLN